MRIDLVELVSEDPAATSARIGHLSSISVGPKQEESRRGNVKANDCGTGMT